MTIKPVDIQSEIYINLSQKLGSVFNQTTWLSLYNKALTVNGIYNANNELIGAFNTFKSKKIGFTYLIVPPYSPSNGLFYLNPAENNSNKITFDKEVHTVIAIYFLNTKAALKISAFPTNVIDMQSYFWKNFKVIPNYTYQLNLQISIDKLFDNLTTEKRKSIRKAEKDNLEIIQCEDYQIVKSLILKTFNRKNKTVNIAYLDKILFNFSTSQNSFAFIAYYNGKPSACTFYVYHNHTCYYLFGGYDIENKHHGAGASCMWQAIKYAKQQQITCFDFEGSMLPEVEKYFREFGGTLTPYYTINKAFLPIEILLKFVKPNVF